MHPKFISILQIGTKSWINLQLSAVSQREANFKSKLKWERKLSNTFWTWRQTKTLAVNLVLLFSYIQVRQLLIDTYVVDNSATWPLQSFIHLVMKSLLKGQWSWWWPSLHVTAHPSLLNNGKWKLTTKWNLQLLSGICASKSLRCGNVDFLIS